MNGLANAILTLLLSWLRIIINRIWSLVNSETGNRFFAFLAEHWLTILLVLGVGGFIVDKIIYLIRWRPFSVRRKRREQQELWESYEAYPQDPTPAQPMYDPNYYARPEPQPAYQQDFYLPQEENGWSEEPIAEIPPEAQTAVYNKPAARSAYRPPLTDVEPVFDEQSQWFGSDALVSEPIAPQTPQAPVSDQYMQDVNAGFARPVPPQQLYAPVQPYAAAPAADPETQPVHPGLDADLFRRNIGLGYEDTPYDAAPYESYDEQPVAVQFTPFTQQTAAEQPLKKNRNPFLNLMRLVGDENAKPSIHDLQKAVDVRDAFREPVYPQPMYRNEDEPT